MAEVHDGATLRAAGLAVVTLDEAKRATSNKRFCSVAVVQEDAYVVGDPFYTTDVTLTNNGALSTGTAGTTSPRR